jgi:hypothetical protein
MGRGEPPLFSTPGDEAEAGQMVKKVFFGAPGESPTADAVMAWLDRVGIDKTMVTGFSTFHHVGEVPRITLEMYFDETPAPPAADVSRETSGGWAARMIGESGPEINIPAKVQAYLVTDSEPPIGTIAAAYVNAHADGLHRDSFSPNCPACQMDKKEG